MDILKSDNLGPLDTACKVIFAAKFAENLKVLELYALNLTSHMDPIYGADLREMKKAGLIKIGNFNKKDREAVMERWQALLVLTGLKEGDLKRKHFLNTIKQTGMEKFRQTNSSNSKGNTSL